MAIIISTATITPKVLNTSDVLYITATGSLVPITGDRAITEAANQSNLTIIVDGTLATLNFVSFSFPAAILLNANDTSSTVTVGASGIIRSLGDGISTTGTLGEVTNLGLIDTHGFGISVGANYRVVNSGTINSGAASIFASGDTYIGNSGKLISGATGISLFATSGGQVQNSGSITSMAAGISVANGAELVQNSGSIVSDGAGLSFSSTTGATLQMTGSVTSASHGVAVSFSSGFILDNSGTFTAGGNGLNLVTGVGSQIDNSGSITAALFGISSASANTMNLMNSGLLSGKSGGLAVTGDNMDITNSETGRIASLNGHGVKATGFAFHLVNGGQIEGGQNGVVYTADTTTGGNLRVTNQATGHIHGSAVGMLIELVDDAVTGDIAQIRNAGVISGETGGLRVTGLPTVLHNSGTISATSGAALSTDGEQDLLIGNTGLIEALAALPGGQVVAIDLKGALGGGAQLLRNFGTITGDVKFGDQISSLRNHGLLDGDVFLDLGNDVYNGRGGEVTGSVFGGAGNDVLQGGAADDVLLGGDGVDTLKGGGGDDLLTAGLGRDVLTGGAGADAFHFDTAQQVSVGAAQDHITDFQSGLDLIEFAFGPAVKTFIGSAAFSGVTGQIRYVAATGIVQADMNGNSVADFTLVLDNHTTLTAADFGL